jgi:hypothetical protein
MQIYLPLVLNFSLLIGMQATISSANLVEIQSLHPYSIQLNNFRIYEEWESFRENAILVADMHPMVILYFTPYNSNQELSLFCEWAAMNVPADTFQIAQEPDILNGMAGYFGGWGIENIDRYVEQFNICSKEINLHSDALISVGVSTCSNWRYWLSSFILREPHNLDVIGIHHYNRYQWYEYNPSDLQTNVEYARIFNLPVWVSEIGYRCVNCSGDMSDFYLEQAEFVSTAIPDAFRFGAHRVYYYGYNPGWDSVDLHHNPLAVEAFKNLQHR